MNRMKKGQEQKHEIRYVYNNCNCYDRIKSFIINKLMSLILLSLGFIILFSSIQPIIDSSNANIYDSSPPLLRLYMFIGFVLTSTLGILFCMKSFDLLFKD